MRNKIDLKKSWLCLFLCLFCFASCEQELDKYYETPGWLKGNAKQLLEKRGNFSIFLKAVSIAGYDEILSGRGIKTIFAPTDEAFKNWLSDNNYASIDNVPINELNKLVTFHLVYYSYSKSMLANYRPEGIYNETEEMAAETAGLYYKFRTHSRDAISTHLDATAPPGVQQIERKVYHYDRFVPVFSSYMFNTKGIDPVYNYQYFYPDNTWTGQNGGFCVSNSSVDEAGYELVTDNGYVYILDKVLDPLETIHTELARSENYSLFLKMYDRFVTYVFDKTATKEYGKGDSLFLSGHLGYLPQIAWEWPTNEYSELAILSRYSHNIFAPDNSSMESFFNSFWKENYASLNDVPFIPIRYLLENHFLESSKGDIVFPEEIAKGKVISNFGSAVSFDPEDTDLRQICANGTLYGLKQLMVPRMFESVTAPAFRYPDYAPFLLMMDNSFNLIPTLMSSSTSFSLFIPNTHVLINNTTIDGSPMEYSNPNTNLYGKERILYEGNDGNMIPLSSGRQSMIAYNHVGTLVSSVGTNKIYKTENSFQYLYLDEAEGKIYSSNIYNNLRNLAPSVRKIYDAYNGTTYELYGDEGVALTMDEYSFGSQIINQTPPEVVAFKNLFVEAKFHLTSPPFNFLLDRFMLFMPTNEAVEAGRSNGEIPTDPVELAQYLKYYFVNVDASGLSGYIFPGAGIQGEMSTYRFLWSENRPARAKLTVIDNGTNLQVKDAKGNVANVVSVFPYIYSKGAVYMIDGLLEFE